MLNTNGVYDEYYSLFNCHWPESEHALHETNWKADGEDDKGEAAEKWTKIKCNCGVNELFDWLANSASEQHFDFSHSYFNICEVL